MRDHGYANLEAMRGQAVPSYSEWGELDLNYETIAKIDASKCIGCQACVSPATTGRTSASIRLAPWGRQGHAGAGRLSECVGCNLCQIVCPVPDCISMVEVKNGLRPATWNQHVNEGAPLRAKKGVH